MQASATFGIHWNTLARVIASNQATDDLLLSYGIVVVITEMTPNLRGMIRQVLDGYVVLINADLDENSKLLTLQHELVHIMRNDFKSVDDVIYIERSNPYHSYGK